MKNKNSVAVILCTLLCVVVLSATATEVGSITPPHVVTTTSTILVVTEPTAQSETILSDVSAIVESGKPVVEYFDETVQEEIDNNLPDGTDKTKLKLDEFITLKKMQSFTDDITVGLQTTLTYQPSHNVITMIGIPDGDTVTWTALKCEVVDGQLTLKVPPEFSDKIADGIAILMILSDASL